jgi:hypothetical protein
MSSIKVKVIGNRDISYKELRVETSGDEFNSGIGNFISAELGMKVGQSGTLTWTPDRKLVVPLQFPNGDVRCPRCGHYPGVHKRSESDVKSLLSACDLSEFDFASTPRLVEVEEVSA